MSMEFQVRRSVPFRGVIKLKRQHRIGAHLHESAKLSSPNSLKRVFDKHPLHREGAWRKAELSEIIIFAPRKNNMLPNIRIDLAFIRLYPLKKTFPSFAIYNRVCNCAFGDVILATYRLAKIRIGSSLSGFFCFDCQFVPPKRFPLFLFGLKSLADLSSFGTQSGSSRRFCSSGLS